MREFDPRPRRQRRGRARHRDARARPRDRPRRAPPDARRPDHRPALPRRRVLPAVLLPAARHAVGLPAATDAPCSLDQAGEVDAALERAAALVERRAAEREAEHRFLPPPERLYLDAGGVARRAGARIRWSSSRCSTCSPPSAARRACQRALVLHRRPEDQAPAPAPRDQLRAGRRAGAGVARRGTAGRVRRRHRGAVPAAGAPAGDQRGRPAVVASEPFARRSSSGGAGAADGAARAAAGLSRRARPSERRLPRPRRASRRRHRGRHLRRVAPARGAARRRSAQLLQEPERAQARRLRRPPRPRRRPLPRPAATCRSPAPRATSCTSSTPAATGSTCRSTASTWCRSTSAPTARRRALDKLGGASWEKVKAKTRESILAMAEELLALYARARARRAATPSARRDPYFREFEATLPVRGDARPAAGDRRRARRPAARQADGPPDLRRRRLRQDRGGAARRLPRRAWTASRWRVLVPTTVLAQQHFDTFRQRFAGYPVRVEMLSRFQTAARAARGAAAALAGGKVDIVIGTHRLLQADVELQGPRPAGRRRGAALRRDAQGDASRSCARRSTSDADRDADPAHAADVADRHPRPERHRDAAGRPPGDPHLRHALRRRRHPRGDPARARPRRAGVLRPQPRRDHRADGAPPARRSCPRRASPSATARCPSASSRR